MQIHRIIRRIIEIRLRARSAPLNRRRALTCQLHSTQNLINITANQSINNRHDSDDVASTQFAKTRRDHRKKAKRFSLHTPDYGCKGEEDNREMSLFEVAFCLFLKSFRGATRSQRRVRIGVVYDCQSSSHFSPVLTKEK